MSDPRIRIVHAIGSMNVGGAERQLVELIERLPPDRFDQSLVLHRREGPLIGRVERAGCPIVGLAPREPPVRRRRGRGVLDVQRSMLGLVAHLRRTRPHVLHSQLDHANIVAAAAVRLAPVDVHLASKLNLCRDPDGRTLSQRMINRAHRAATEVHANSAAVVDDLVRHEGVDRRRVRLIPNGVDLTRFDPRAGGRRGHAARAAAGTRPEDRLLVCVANLHSYKGHLDLVRAFALLDPNARNLRLLLVGRDDGAGDAIRSLAATLGVGERVRLAGYIEAVEDVLAAADLVVHPSEEEGLPNAVLEAMATGKAVVATDVGGTGELIDHGRSGLLVEPRDPVALADAIRDLIDDRNRAAALGQAARRRAEDRFGVERMVEDFVRCYEQLVDAARRRSPEPSIDTASTD